MWLSRTTWTEHPDDHSHFPSNSAKLTGGPQGRLSKNHPVMSWGASLLLHWALAWILVYPEREQVSHHLWFIFIFYLIFLLGLQSAHYLFFHLHFPVMHFNFSGWFSKLHKAILLFVPAASIKHFSLLIIQAHSSINYSFWVSGCFMPVITGLH